MLHNVEKVPDPPFKLIITLGPAVGPKGFKRYFASAIPISIPLEVYLMNAEVYSLVWANVNIVRTWYIAAARPVAKGGGVDGRMLVSLPVR